ncbi:hypothetical protein EC991_008385 [Linnemannia zychae]|nr:hypothetical protein EC991_008385 [Linnemannia zychae]
MAQHVHARRRPHSRALISLLLVSLSLSLISSSLASPLPPIHVTGNALIRVPQVIEERRTVPWLERRAPTAAVPGPSPEGTPSEGGGAGSTTTTTDPPIQTTPTTPSPVTTTSSKDLPPPVTTTAVTTASTSSKGPVITTTSTTTSSSQDPDTTITSTSHSRQSRPSTDRPTGTGSNGPLIITTTSSTSTPTGTPVNPDESTKPPILPIVIGSVLGAGALIGAAVFFFLRFRKHRRFDSKRPLSFLALSADDHSIGTESTSARALGTDALYDANRPITSQSSLRYSPPVMSSIKRYSYQSSEHSGAAGGQIAQWSQDDESAALVGGPSRQQDLMLAEQAEDRYSARFHDGGVYSHEHLPMPDSEQSFVASSMIPLARNDPRHARYSQQQQQQQQQLQAETPENENEGHPSKASPQRSAPLQVLNPEAEQGAPTS